MNWNNCYSFKNSSLKMPEYGDRVQTAKIAGQGYSEAIFLFY